MSYVCNDNKTISSDKHHDFGEQLFKFTVEKLQTASHIVL